MKLKVRFKQVNEGFSQEFADFHNEGKESLENSKHKWEVGYTSESIEEVDLNQLDEFTFIGVDPDGNENGLILKDVCVLNCFEKETKRMETYIVSNSILSSKPNFQAKTNYKNNQNDTVYQYFYIKADAEFVELQPGWFVSLDELPNELK